MSTTESLPKGWSEKPLGELLSFQNGANADGSAYGRGVKFANVLEVLENSHLKAKQIPGMVSVPKSVIQAFRLIRGDVLFNRTSETQDEVALASVYLDDSEAIFGGFVIRGRRKTNELDPVWSGYGLRADRVRKQITAVSQGAVRANIGQDNLGKVIIWLPPPEEQRAIAGVLSDVDALIESLDTLITKKRDLKQATMQQLLTGKKRLPGFSDEWSDKTVSDLGPIKKGGGIPKSAIKSYGEPCILYGEIYTRYAEATETLYSKVSKEVAAKAVAVQKGDIVFAGSGETAEEIGKCVAYLGEQAAYAGGDTLILRPVGHDSRFLGYLLNSRSVNQQKANRGQGSSVVHLYGRDLKTIEIQLPHQTEQIAIADVLSDMDAEIDALVARRNKSEFLKIGLMQELLSGRRRLV